MKKGKKGILVTVVICMVIALALFLCLIQVEKELLKNDRTETVVSCIKKAEAGILITEENAAEYFALKKVPADLAIADTYGSIDELVGRYANRDISSGELVYKAILNTDARLLNIEEPTEISISVKDESYAAAGSIRKGDKVSVYVRSKDATEWQEVLPEVVVHEAYNAASELIGMSDTTGLASMFTFFIPAADSVEVLEKVYSGDVVILKAAQNQ